MRTVPKSMPSQARETHRAITYDAGLAAERSAARQYIRQGMAFRNHRWRGKAGEIDIVFENGDEIVFVEVKKARTFDRAVQSLSKRQTQRLFRAAQEYVGHEPKGSLTDIRFDVALVNETGDVRILENAFA